MDLGRVTSTGHATAKGRPSHSSRTTADTFLEGLHQFLGQAHRHLVITSRPLVRSSSRSPTCMESNPQSSPLRTRMMRMLSATEVIKAHGLEEVMIFIFTLIATKILARPSHIHTTTRQEKGGAFSQATRGTIISKSKRLKCSELMSK